MDATPVTASPARACRTPLCGTPLTAELHHYIASRDLGLVHFTKDQRKDDVAREYLAGHDGREQVLFVGRAQERTMVWRTRRRRDAATGRSYPWLFKESAMVNHWYVYGFDRDFGPFFIKFCGYFPFTAQIYLNGHEYAKQQCRRLFMVAAMAAEMERDLIRERTLDGLRAAQAQGRRGGRPAQAKGESITAIARHLRIGRSTLYRALQPAEDAAAQVLAESTS